MIWRNLADRISLSSWSSFYNEYKTEHVTKLCTTMFDMSMYDNKKYNFSRPPAFKRQRVEYQSNQKLLHHYQHLNIQPNSYIHS